MPNHLLISKHATVLNTDIVAGEIDKPKKGITNKKARESSDEALLRLRTRWSNLARNLGCSLQRLQIQYCIADATGVTWPFPQ